MPSRKLITNTAALPEKVLFYTGEMPTGALRPELPPATPVVAAAAAMPAPEAPAPAPAAVKVEESDTERSDLPIASIGKSPNGKFIVTLANGEIWRQLNSDDTQLAIPDRPGGMTAEIKRTFFGTTMLKISGTYKAFKVTRIDNAQ